MHNACDIDQDDQLAINFLCCPDWRGAITRYLAVRKLHTPTTVMNWTIILLSAVILVSGIIPQTIRSWPTATVWERGVWLASGLAMVLVLVQIGRSQMRERKTAWDILRRLYDRHPGHEVWKDYELKLKERKGDVDWESIAQMCGLASPGPSTSAWLQA